MTATQTPSALEQVLRLDEKGISMVSRHAAPAIDGPGIVTRGLELRGVNVTMRTCDFVASTDAIDSYDEVVEQKWDLDRYNANPVVLYAHASRDLPIGLCTKCEVVRGALECTVQFCTEDMNPLAEQVWKMVQAKVLRGVSVGFVPKTVRMEKRDGRDIYVLSDNVLHEISVVPIPANQEALAKMKAAAARHAPAVPNELDKNVEAHEETNMSETNETKALLAARESEIATLKTSVTTAEARAKAADDKAAELDKKLADVTKAKAEVETRAAALTTERDAAVAKVLKLEEQATERDVEALVGVKIDPAQKDAFLALAKKDRAQFDAIVTTLAVKPVLAQVIPAEKGAVKTGGATGDDITALMNEEDAAE